MSAPKPKQLSETESLKRIRTVYGAMLEEAATTYKHRPEVLAGIMQRETAGGLSPLMKDVDGVDDGNPADDVGDHGYGLGLMQIDRRYFPEFYKSGRWKDPLDNIRFAAAVLAQKRSYIARKTVGYNLTTDDLERAAVASYNAGEGRVVRAIQVHGKAGFDIHTAHGNYSADVLRLAALYAGLAPDAPEAA